MKLCSCGSGEGRTALYDARGIFCAYVCSQCEARVMKTYRIDIFTDPNYACNEAIDEDE